MELKNCKRCGRLYQGTGGNVCPVCMDNMDKDFLKVREYIYNNPSANVSSIAKETGVDEKTILEFLRDGRLELYSISKGLECKRCGAWIKTGRYCEDCIKELKVFTDNKNSNVSSVIKNDNKKSNKAKMHTINNIRKNRF